MTKLHFQCCWNCCNFPPPSPSRCWQSLVCGSVWGSLESHFGVVASGDWCQDSDQIGATDQMGHPQYCRLSPLFISPCQSWVKYSIMNIRSQGQSLKVAEGGIIQLFSKKFFVKFKERLVTTCTESV